ncbi:hypothetical protein [Pacificibacter sp. AS14]|uniref:hypothetical protein n=1 Tax=Pacificibacter sp. AS14 TaxID=3135785 RepID=UPI0031779E5E
MTKLFRKKIVLFKMEDTYGVDPNPTGAANAILTKDFKFMPMEGNDVNRDLEQPYMGSQGTVATELHAKITFDVELSPSGTAGTAPAWGPLLRACAMAETIVAGTSVTYNPVSDGHESATLYFGLDGTKYVTHGALGNVTFMVEASGVPYLKFEFTGLFTEPTEIAMDTPVLTAFKKPQVVTKANTTFDLNGIALILRKLSLNAGNSVDTSFLIGEEAVDITDKEEAVEFTVKAVALTTFDPYAAALSDDDLPLTLVHGTTAGRIATLEIPNLEIQRPSSLEDVNGKVEWPLRAQALPTSGNDQWTLTLT